MTAQTLYDALTAVRDDLVTEALQTRPAPRARRWRRPLAIAAAALLAVGLGAWALPRLPIGGNEVGDGIGSGAQDAMRFDSYAGPVLPLTAQAGGQQLTVDRDITYDFSRWTPSWISNEQLAGQSAGTADVGDAGYGQALAEYQTLYPDGGCYQQDRTLLVTDAYTLHNPTDSPVQVRLLYPFVSSLHELSDEQPTLYADGAALSPTLLAGGRGGVADRDGTGRDSNGGMDGGDTGTAADVGTSDSTGAAASTGSDANNSADAADSINIDANDSASAARRLDSWQSCRALLADGRYRQAALDAWPDFSDIPVTVYEISNAWALAPDDAGGFYPNIHAELTLDYAKTAILSYGFNSGVYDAQSGAMRQGFSVPQPPASGSGQDTAFYQSQRAWPRYLVAVGQPPSAFQLVGTATGGPDSTDYLAWGTQIGADCRQYQSDLESILRTMAEQLAQSGSRYAASAGDFELFFGLLKEDLLQRGLSPTAPAWQGQSGALEELSFDAARRVFYLETEVTVPAGGSVTLTAQMQKQPSYDHTCHGATGRDLAGYDLATALDSSLHFTTQTATALHTDSVVLVYQNYGFDWENGVTTVTLDPETTYYYMAVRRRKEG